MNEIDVAAFFILFLGIVILTYPLFLLIFQKATEKKSNRYIQIFLNQLKEKDIQIIGDIRVAQYNGPTTIPPFRKNEILIPVSYK